MQVLKTTGSLGVPNVPRAQMNLIHAPYNIAANSTRDPHVICRSHVLHDRLPWTNRSFELPAAMTDSRNRNFFNINKQIRLRTTRRSKRHKCNWPMIDLSTSMPQCHGYLQHLATQASRIPEHHWVHNMFKNFQLFADNIWLLYFDMYIYVYKCSDFTNCSRHTWLWFVWSPSSTPSSTSTKLWTACLAAIGNPAVLQTVTNCPGMSRKLSAACTIELGIKILSCDIMQYDQDLYNFILSLSLSLCWFTPAQDTTGQWFVSPYQTASHLHFAPSVCAFDLQQMLKGQLHSEN